MSTMQEALAAKQKLKEILQGLDGISGVGLSWDKDGQPCVRVNVAYSIPDASRRKIPPRVGTVPVQVQAIGRIHAE